MDRETVLDRKVHIEAELVLEIPEVPPLCQDMDALKQRLRVGDCELYCEQEGEGRPLVLLNGGPGATHHCFHPHFSLARDFATVVYYDQRGCGSSTYEKGSGYSIDQAVDDLEGLREALKIEKWVVLGHSYGGLLAQCYTVKYPAGGAGLVLVGSSLAMPAQLKRTRQYDFLSEPELRKIRTIHRDRKLSVAQRVYNAFLNGDWKRQSYWRPSRDRIAQTALYEWKHDPEFRNSVGGQTQNVDLQGAFEGCPIPTIIVEGKWDLTWNTDKPKKLHENHPGAKLVFLESSSHSPFEDEPEMFFQLLRDFLEGLPDVSDQDLSQWQEHLADWRKRKESSFAHVLRTTGWGRKSNEKIAESYSKEKLDELDDPWLLLKSGFALYDLERYDDALSVFLEMATKTEGDRSILAASLVWQGHMLDLLDQREEAIAVYQRVVELNVTDSMGHSQFGMRYSPSRYAAQRVKAPFVRVENRQTD